MDSELEGREGRNPLCFVSGLLGIVGKANSPMKEGNEWY